MVLALANAPLSNGTVRFDGSSGRQRKLGVFLCPKRKPWQSALPLCLDLGSSAVAAITTGAVATHSSVGAALELLELKELLAVTRSPDVLGSTAGLTTADAVMTGISTAGHTGVLAYSAAPSTSSTST
jgi:hypothetical protein